MDRLLLSGSVRLKQTLNLRSLYPRYVINASVDRSLTYRIPRCVRISLPSRDRVSILQQFSFFSLEAKSVNQQSEIDSNLYASILKLGRKRNWQGILDLIDSADKNGNLTIHCTRSAIKVLSDNYRLEEATRLLERSTNICDPLQVQSYHLVLKAKCRSNDCNDVSDFLSIIEAKGLANEITYAIVMRWSITSVSLYYTSKLMSRMRENGIKPTLQHYNILMNICGKRGRMNYALYLLQDMKKNNIEPDIKTYGSAIDACSKVGDYKIATTLFFKLRSQDISPSVVIWTNLIKSYLTANKFDIALHQLSRMKTSGVNPNFITYNCLISAAVKNGNINGAEFLFKEMLNDEIVPDLSTYDAMIRGYSKAEQLEKVENMFKSMISQGIIPDRIICYHLMLAFTSANHTSKLFEWFSFMEDHMQFDEGIICFMIDELHNAGNINEADSLFSRSLKRGIFQSIFRETTENSNGISVIDAYRFGAGVTFAALRYKRIESLKLNLRLDIKSSKKELKETITEYLNKFQVYFSVTETKSVTSFAINVPNAS